MKKLILCVLCVLLFSCNSKINYDGEVFDDYDMYVDYSLNHLKSPVVITSIIKRYASTQNTATDTTYFVTVKDSEKKIKFYNSRESDFIENISSTHNVGDTIR